MFLTEIKINPRKRASLGLLANPERIHAAVLGCYPPGQSEGAAGRTLWRLDRPDKVNISLIISSPLQPDYQQLVDSYSWSTGEVAKSRSMDPLLQRLAAGQRWGFQLTANPTHSVKSADNPKGRGKRLGHVTAGQQLDWLLARASRDGFSLDGPRGSSAQVVRRELIRFHKGAGAGHQVTLSQATYRGVLTVTDPQQLRGSLCRGIGPAKSYGCGLLTLMPARPE